MSDEEYCDDLEIDAFIEKYGEIRILEHLAGSFDGLFQDGVIGRPADREKIGSLLRTIEHRIRSHQ